ncbi:MAG TPA: gliding motility-associated C-terminal domain-containing protein, partial [Cytophaga sp.]|nr:gliding motility-associated C-terminal domain-containing protein [Cytophaga sp.]
NDPLTFRVYGTDADPGDILTLTIANPQRGMHFPNVTDSSSTISSTFSWTPNCNDLHPGTYDVYFIIKDNSCMVNPSDTVHQTIIVEQDEVSFDGMLVTNLITPNGDGLNDYYQIPGIPVGNCDKYFKGIEIYNRWGARVFYSQDRLFKWHPNVSDGMYYFSIDLNYEIRKGWLQITQ